MSETDDRLSRRRFLQATGGAAAAATVAGCSLNDDGGDGTGGDATPTMFETGTEPSDGDTGGTLQLINDTITTFDPIAATDTASGRVIRQLFEGLTKYPNGEQKPVNQLATNIEVSEDFTTYTVSIAEGVTFHDGSELTAQDIIYSWERLAQSENSNRQYFILDSLGVAHETQDGSYVPGSIEVTATGDYELEIQLAEPFHDSLQMMAYSSFAVVPEGIVGDIEGHQGEMSQSEFATSNPVGTGPFQFVEWTEGDHAEVEAYGDYRRDGLPYLDGIYWAVIEEDQPRYTYSTNKNADILEIPTSKYSRDKVTVVEETDAGQELGFYGPLDSGEASGENVRYVRSPTLTTYYIAFNAKQTPKPVRQAAAYALNREDVVESVFKNRYQTGFNLTPPGIYPGGASAYNSDVEENYPYGVGETRIADAKQVMEDAGYGEDNTFDLTVNAYNSGAFQQLANGLRDKLSSAYIEISVEPTDFSTIIEKGNQGTLQCYTLGWLADWPAPDNFLQLMAPSLTDVDELGSAATTYTDWDDADTQARRDAQAAWEKIQNNQGPTEEAQQARDEAAVTMEQANWEDVILLNVAHAADERFWYPNTNVAPFGAMGSSRQVHDTTWKEGGGE
ncbi:ABC transporter substrate-binding protein [Haloglomus halophilum]|uniref:ABC transporter substrate-binding protein n=1 Tax=Haloglomus halophilum TaxID=2962672 RepID=UPI0020CA1EB0|nr:ABC transporter substrate-binding protein [Haloglomus halophilum]